MVLNEFRINSFFVLFNYEYKKNMLYLFFITNYFYIFFRQWDNNYLEGKIIKNIKKLPFWYRLKHNNKINYLIL